MKKSLKYAIWILGGILLLLIVAIIATNTLPYFTSPRAINSEDCEFVARDRATKAMAVQEQHPDSVEKEGNFTDYYNAFYQICIESGI